MPRARNIKPSFFKNEDLVELDFSTRLLFIGLWTLADREGRLENRPKRIKMELFPSDDIDAVSALVQLEDSGFIESYESRGKKIIQIRNFLKHQAPHHTEKASELPPKDGELTVKQPLMPRESRKHDGGNPPDSLIPDSLIPDSLIPDSLIPDPGLTEEASDEASRDATRKNSPIRCPYQQIIQVFNNELPMLASVRDLTDQRKQVLKARWRERSERQSLEWWKSYFARVSKSDFLTGRTQRPGVEPFVASFDWLIRPTNMAKVIEGNYESRTPTQKLNKQEALEEGNLQVARRWASGGNHDA